MLECARCHEQNPDHARFCLACGSPLPEAGPLPLELRKTVTVLFCDVTGSTSLGEQQDPEQLRRVLSRYYEEVRAVLERHGGRVEKFIGDAVMAVFGIPVLHEDDALRAVRAAVELRGALAALNDELEQSFGVRIEVRTGVNTGEVIAGDTTRGHSFVAGDAVNVAQRLEAAAPPGEILIGEETYRLARQAAQVVAVEPLELKGKRDPVVAYRLLDVAPGTAVPARRLDAPMIGRERELSILQDAYARSVREASCHLFTVLGTAGVGKSRLVAEALGELAEGTTLLSGACLPYGEGITFWPVLEMVKQATGLTEDDAPAEARRKIAAILDSDPAAERVAERVAEVIGFGEAAGTAEDGFWGVRKLLEGIARRGPAVVVFDDINWAEATLLDLIEHLADWARDAPLLVLCMSRPELLDLRPGWGGGKRNATTIFLEPLSEDESVQLIDSLLGQAALDGRVRARIQEAAAGNPLFVEETLAMLIDDGRLERKDGRWVAVGDLSGFRVPRSIQVLLASRLDQLEDAERRVLERGAVEGNVFHLGAVEALSPAGEEAGVASCLSALVRKELVRSHRSVFADEEAFSFRHPLIREAAYDALPKQVRGELHEAYAGWLAQRAGEYEELVGYHLEQAYRYRAELGPMSEGDREVGVRASDLLASAGRRALARGDVTAAVDLLGRAALLRPEDGGQVALLPELGAALREAGELAMAEQVLAEAVEAAQHSGDRKVELAATIERASLLLLRDPAQTDQLLAEIEAAVPELEQLEDDRVLALAWTLMGLRFGVWRGRFARGEEAFARALGYARRAGDRRQEGWILSYLCFAAAHGPTPVPDAIQRCDEIREQARDDRLVEAGVARYLSMLEARRGRFEEGRMLAASARATYEELGMQVIAWAASALAYGDIELLAGEYEAAERQLREGSEALERMGERGYRSSVAAFRARALYGQGRLEEAETFARSSQEEAADDDLWSQVLSCGTLAKVLAQQGAFEEAEASARRAIRLVEDTDALDLHGGALLDRAEVLVIAGHGSYAESCAQQALDLFRRKGNEVLAEQAETMLGRAQAQAATASEARGDLAP